MSWLTSFLHPERGYEKAQDELNKYYEQGQHYLEPYNQHGLDIFGKYSSAMDKLLNPAALHDEWSKNYRESDLAKQNEAMATQRGLEAASSMGLLGSSPAISAIQSGTAGIVARDRQQYLDDLLKKYLSGIGIGQDIYSKGANTATSLSNNAINMGNNSAQLEYGKQNAPGNLFSNLLNTGLNLGGSFLTGGMGKGSFGRGAWSTIGGQ